MSGGMPFSATGAVDGNLIIWDNSSLSVRSTCRHPEVSARLCGSNTLPAGCLLLC